MQAEALLVEAEADMSVIADKACDSHAILRQIAQSGTTVVISSGSNRTERRPLDRKADAIRNLVE